MATIASDDYTGTTLDTSISGRTLNNALGGSGTRTYESNGTAALLGNGANALKADSSAGWSNVAVGIQNYKARVKFDPSSGTSAIQLTGRKGVASGNTPYLGIRLMPGHTALAIYLGDGSSINPPGGTSVASTALSAPGAPVILEGVWNGNNVTGRLIRQSDDAVLATVTYTATSAPTGNYLAFGFSDSGNTGLFDDLTVDDSVSGDVTAPTLTSASASATSGTTSSGSVTTNEANGTLYWLTNTSNTATATAVKAGSSQAVTAAGAQSTSSTGLSPGTTYYTHFLHRDAAGNDSAVLSSASFTTPSPDATAPTFAGSITVGAKTSSTIDISWPAGSDDTAVVAYDVRINGGSWIDNGLALTYSASGLDALTSYTFEVTARDAAGNRSTPALSVTTSTYRDGALASTILLLTGPQGGNPAGFLYDFASTVATSAWLSYTIVSGPTPAGGSLDANAMGAFSYTGPAPATMVIQPEVNGANAPETITVTLYDNSVSLGAASMASTPVYGVGSVSQAAPVPLTGTAVAVASAYGSGQIAQGAPVVLAGAAFAVIPAMGAGGLVQGVPVALSATPFTVIPVFSAGALSQAAPVALMGTALSVSTAYGPGAISDAPTFTSMAPSPVCTTYRRDSYPAHTFQKLAGETLDFDIDFRYELRCTQDSARIQDPVEIQAGQGVEVLGAYWVPGLRRVKMWVTGGESQGKSDISIWLNTEAGRRLQVDVRVQIK